MGGDTISKAYFLQLVSWQPMEMVSEERVVVKGKDRDRAAKRLLLESLFSGLPRTKKAEASETSVLETLVSDAVKHVPKFPSLTDCSP